MTARTTPTYRALGTFARAYLHQDWTDEYTSVAEAARAYCSAATPRSVAALERDLDRLIGESATWSGTALRAFFADRLGSAWCPPSHRQLVALRTAVARARDRR